MVKVELTPKELDYVKDRLEEELSVLRQICEASEVIIEKKMCHSILKKLYKLQEEL